MKEYNSLVDILHDYSLEEFAVIRRCFMTDPFNSHKCIEPEEDGCYYYCQVLLDLNHKYNEHNNATKVCRYLYKIHCGENVAI